MSESVVDRPRPGFQSMSESTHEDWGIISDEFLRFSAKLPDRGLAHLKLLDGDYSGFPIDRLRHSLLTDIRKHRPTTQGLLP